MRSNASILASLTRASKLLDSATLAYLRGDNAVAEDELRTAVRELQTLYTARTTTGGNNR